MTDTLASWARLQKALQDKGDKNPGDAAVLVKMGRALKLEGHRPEAAQAFSAAFDLDPQQSAACLELSQMLKDAGHFQNADELRILGLEIERARHTRMSSAQTVSGRARSTWFISGREGLQRSKGKPLPGADSTVEDPCGTWSIQLLESPEVAPSRWNAALAQCAGDENQWAVFAAADLELQIEGIWHLLNETRALYGAEIIGVAGGADININAPLVWSAMCETSSRKGRSPYRSASGEVIPNVFGPLGGRVDVLDEAFLAVHIPSAVSAGWRFNEAFPSYHCVLASCIDARCAGLRLAVAPIEFLQHPTARAVQRGETWKASEDRFRLTYGSLASQTTEASL